MTLIFGTILGSEVIVDKTLLPRFLSINILFLISLFALKNRFNIRFDAYILIFISFYFINLISVFWSVSIPEALFQSQLVFTGLLCFILTLILKRDFEGFEDVFLKTLMFFILFSFFLAIKTIISLDYFDPYKVKSICANNNLYSGFLFLSLAFSLNGILRLKKFFKYLSFFNLLLSLFMMIILQSRAIYLALLLSLILIVVMIIIRYREVIKKRFVYYSIIFVSILSLMVFTFHNSLDPIRQNYFKNKLIFWQYFDSSVIEYSGIESEAQSSEDNNNLWVNNNKNEISTFDLSESYYENASLRMIFWKKSAYLFKANPILGVGSGNWRLSIASAKGIHNPDHTSKNFTYSYPHNEFVGLITELGIIGLFSGS